MKRLWLILFVIIGCASNWKPVTLELKDGSILKGEVRTRNSLNEEVLFITLDDKGMRIKYNDIEKAFVGKEEVPLERIENSYNLIEPGEYPTYTPKYDPNAGKEVAQYLLNAYEEYKSESDYTSPSLSFGTGGNKGCHVYGKIKFVEFGEDYKVKFVGFGENLKIKYVDFGESKVGNWKIVDFGQDYKIKVVEFGEDFSVKTVDFGQGCN